MFETLLQQTFTASREDSEVYSKDPVIASDTSLGITLSPPNHLMVILEGFSVGTGTVTVAGTDSANVSVQEVFTFAGNGRLVGDQEFKTIDSITTSGLADETTVGSMKILSVSETGEIQPSLVTLPSIEGRLSRPAEEETISLAGVTTRLAGTIIVKGDVDVKVGDKLVLGADEYEVVTINPRYNRVGQKRHITIGVKEFEGPAQ